MLTKTIKILTCLFSLTGFILTVILFHDILLPSLAQTNPFEIPGFYILYISMVIVFAGLIFNIFKKDKEIVINRINLVVFEIAKIFTILIANIIAIFYYANIASAFQNSYIFLDPIIFVIFLLMTFSYILFALFDFFTYKKNHLLSFFLNRIIGYFAYFGLNLLAYSIIMMVSFYGQVYNLSYTILFVINIAILILFESLNLFKLKEKE